LRARPNSDHPPRFTAVTSATCPAVSSPCATTTTVIIAMIFNPSPRRYTISGHNSPSQLAHPEQLTRSQPLPHHHQQKHRHNPRHCYQHRHHDLIVIVTIATASTTTTTTTTATY
jgi:hypothetical protein